MQEDRYRHSVQETIITPIAQKLQQQKNSRAAKVAATKVDFYTMVRGE